MTKPSLTSAYFDDVYAANADPWGFETSAYEAAKYDDTLAALGDRRFAHAFEIGCSIGVLTRRLAPRCDRLLAVDVSEPALQRARERCADQPQVAFATSRLPEEFPAGRFDLVLMSEVGYYWSRGDLDRVLAQAEAALDAGGLLLLVHWTPPVADYPLTGDEVHDAALAGVPAGRWLHASGWRRPSYRLDLLQKPAAPRGR